MCNLYISVCVCMHVCVCVCACMCVHASVYGGHSSVCEGCAVSGWTSVCEITLTLVILPKRS